MERLLADLQQHALSWAFLQPVNAEDVPDYHEVIKEPMGVHLQRNCIIVKTILTTPVQISVRWNTNSKRINI